MYRTLPSTATCGASCSRLAGSGNEYFDHVPFAVCPTYRMWVGPPDAVAEHVVANCGLPAASTAPARLPSQLAIEATNDPLPHLVALATAGGLAEGRGGEALGWAEAGADAGATD